MLLLSLFQHWENVHIYTRRQRGNSARAHTHSFCVFRPQMKNYAAVARIRTFVTCEFAIAVCEFSLLLVLFVHCWKRILILSILYLAVV